MSTPLLGARRCTAALMAVLAALSVSGPLEPPLRAPTLSDTQEIGLQAQVSPVHGLRVDDRLVPVHIAAPERVQTGAGFVVGGTVRLTDRRSKTATVQLLQQSGSRWVVRQARRTDRRGQYRFDVAGYPRAQSVTLRARAVTGGVRRDSAPVRVRVVPAASPTTGLGGLGDPTDFTRINGPGWRWDPCQPISWRYNAARGYPRALAHLQEAFARIGRHTGLRFQYLGTTGHVPFAGQDTPSGADVFVSWASPAQSRYLKGGVVGVATPSGRGTGNGAGEFLTGSVLLDSSQTDDLATGFATRGGPTWGQVMVHELLHVMGLGHARAGVQLMAPYLTEQNHRFGAGDLAGMKAIGIEQGCIVDSQR